MNVRLTNDFGTYIIEDAEFVDSAMFGRCLRGRYHREGDHPFIWIDCGVFRLDRSSWEVLSGQMELAA